MMVFIEIFEIFEIFEIIEIIEIIEIHGSRSGRNRSCHDRSCGSRPGENTDEVV